MDWREAGDVRWLQAELPRATAAFSTRVGGASQPPFDSLNLGAFTGDERDAVVENRVRLAAALGFEPERIAIGRQVHGTGLATHMGPQAPSAFTEPHRPIPEVDGHVTAEASFALLVLAADCLPIALAGPGGVAMLHCGWRGLAAGIVARGVEAIGATDAAIGPGIGPCCYEVGAEVLSAVEGRPSPPTRQEPQRLEGRAIGTVSRCRIDLPEVARRLLHEAGVERVESSGLCTSCEAELFFSHRRDAGSSGRQAGLVWRDGEAC
jgi:YfiH family protein